ncbi:Nucleoside-diphosphate-sugar epimerase [Micromonospora sediminicola]|uniref:Nucleoside-diphosphate-sugar epimerase n=1 Tax=Micromonospora sediminicola TaxID=946078 RepID=A0A1A9BET6_9ACTN|nr:MULTISPECIES: NAD-dependent epimerase/dehydratase family protein [Micromonospora]PGH45678.1 epimerase [Micromonospora sp. WMMA1996]SBT67601.1 Nucleoside-diphosphate-sugar epimerase [Micromonospora sediminicola]
MRALILGGAGFIGLHLAERLVEDGHRVVLVDDFSRGRADERLSALGRNPSVEVRSADLTTESAWKTLPRDVDQVYLLAAVVGVRNVEADPTRVLRVNTLTALHLVDWVRPGHQIFFSSTSEVYAGGVDAGVVPVPTAEDVPLMIADVKSPRLAYAVSKLTGEALVLHGARARGATAVVGRFHNVYGPRMGSDHVIPEMALRALSGEDPFRVWGADQYRAFCHVDDAVEAVVRLMATPAADGEIVHLGNDREETNIADLARLVLSMADSTASIQVLPAPARSVHRRRPDLGKLRRLTGYEPAVPLVEGVRRTFEWYRDQPATTGAGSPRAAAPASR